ncbi:hypothetical protein [Colwellia sp. 75C3]|nr:hypothetical protein [Colwellia sp. 75C3]
MAQFTLVVGAIAKESECGYEAIDHYNESEVAVNLVYTFNSDESWNT